MKLMTLKFKQTIAITVLALLTSSCGLFGGGEKAPEYYGSPEAEPLTIPEGLDNPAAQTALTIDYPVVPLPEREISAVPPRVLANQGDDSGNSKIRWSSDGIYILVADDTDSVQRRLGYVIERSGMQMQGRAPDGGYRFDYQQPKADSDEGFFSKVAFWRDDGPNYSGSYRTLSEPDGENTRVYLRYADGGEVPMDAAEHVLAILKERLG